MVDKNFIKDIKELILESKRNVLTLVNSELSLLYWNIGEKLINEIIKSKRAKYGKQVISTLSTELTRDYGKGWNERQLRYCIRIAQIFPDKEILHALRAKLSWTHLRILILLDNHIKREFYVELTKLENWSSRQLQERINSQLFERTAISKKPEEIIKNELEKLKEEKSLTKDVIFRDPYILDFLGLSDNYSEKDLESSILAELQKFIIELGSDFAFLARQKRITIDNRDYYIDLLFYHRRLKCLIVIDLKIGEFEAGFKGQMELYLKYLEKYEMIEGENIPIGLILCTGKNKEHVELLQLLKSNIHVASYITQLPSKKILQEKLHQSIEIAKNKLENKT